MFCTVRKQYFNLMVTKEYVRNKIIIFGLFKIVALVLGSENADWMEDEDEDDSWMESNDDTLFEGDIMLVGAGQKARAGNEPLRIWLIVPTSALTFEPR